MKKIFATTVDVTNTETGKTVTAIVDKFKEGDSLAVWLAQMRIVLTYSQKHNIYVGSAVGREFTALAPKLMGTQR
jgi:hypothetical protein